MRALVGSALPPPLIVASRKRPLRACPCCNSLVSSHVPTCVHTYAEWSCACNAAFHLWYNYDFRLCCFPFPDLGRRIFTCAALSLFAVSLCLLSLTPCVGSCGCHAADRLHDCMRVFLSTV